MAAGKIGRGAVVRRRQRLGDGDRRHRQPARSGRRHDGRSVGQPDGDVRVGDGRHEGTRWRRHRAPLVRPLRARRRATGRRVRGTGGVSPSESSGFDYRPGRAPGVAYRDSAERVDAHRDHLRRREPAVLHQRRARGDESADRQHRGRQSAAAHRRQQRLRRILPGRHRRSADLQPRPVAGGDRETEHVDHPDRSGRLVAHRVGRSFRGPPHGVSNALAERRARRIRR